MPRCLRTILFLWGLEMTKELDGLIEALNKAVQGADFYRACGGDQRAFKRPVVFLGAQRAETQGEAETVLTAELYNPADGKLREAERIMEETFAFLAQRLQNITAVLREPPKKDQNAVVLRGRVTLREGTPFTIDGTALTAQAISAAYGAQTREVFSVGSSAPAAVIPTGGVFRVKITGGAGLSGEEKNFSLEFGGYRYENCHWVSFAKSGSSPLSTGEFVSRKRTALKAEET